MRKLLILLAVGLNFLSCSQDETLANYTGDGILLTSYLNPVSGLWDELDSYYFVDEEQSRMMEGPEGDATRTIIMSKYFDNVNRLNIKMRANSPNIQDGKFMPNKKYFGELAPIEAGNDEAIDFIINYELPKGAIIGKLELWLDQDDGKGGREKFYDYFDVLNQ